MTRLFVSHLATCYLGTALILSLYVALSVPSISLPGLQYDEAGLAPAAIALIKGHVNFNLKPMWSISVAGHAFPVMALEYLGFLKSYLLALSFFLFGINIVTLRLTTIFVTVIGLLFFSRFVSEAFGRRTALVVMLLIATDPSLILYSRNDWGPISIALLLKSSALFCMCRWWKSGGNCIYLVAAGMLVGLGIYDKANFLWFAAASFVAGAGAVVMSEKNPRVTVRDITLSLVALIVTSAPLWVLNVFAHWPTFQTATSLDNRTTQTLAQRVGILHDVLNGQATDLWMFGQPMSSITTAVGTLLWPLFLAAMAFLLIVGLFGQSKRRHAFVLLALIGIIFIQICLTPLKIGPHHWIFLYPLPHLAIGFMFCDLADCLKIFWQRKTFWLTACVIVFFTAVSFNIITVFNHQKLMKGTGGSTHWSDSIYTLAEVLQNDYPNRPIQLMDWGFAAQLALLSAGSLHVQEPFWPYLKASQVPEEFVRLVANPSNVFIVHADFATKFPHIRTLLDEAAAKAGATIVSEREFFDRRGNVIYKLIEFSGQSSKIASRSLGLIP